VVVVPALVVGARGASPEEEREVRSSRVPPTRADDDLRRIRDIFRFGGPSPDGHPEGAEDDVAPDAVRPEAGLAPSPPSPARLVGLVRRPGRLLAALAVDGEVVLLEAGQTAGELTVLRITDDGVLLEAGGEEITLRLP